VATCFEREKENDGIFFFDGGPKGEEEEIVLFNTFLVEGGGSAFNGLAEENVSQVREGRE